MKIMRILGVVVMAAIVSGCTLSEAQYAQYRVVLKERPALRADLRKRCVTNISRQPRQKTEVVAEMVDLKVSTFPQTFCQRMESAYLSGRLTYADYRDMMRKKPTPRLLRILRGKRP